MFEGLKKKFSNFISSLSQKEEGKVIAEAESSKNELESNSIAVPESPKAETPKAKPETKPEKIEPKAEPKPEAEHMREPQVHAIHHEKPAAPQQPTRIEPRHEKETKQQNVTMGTRIKGIFLKEVKVSNNDLEPFLEDLRSSLLESDVNYEVTEKILNELKNELTAKPISSREISSEITRLIRNSILRSLSNIESKDLVMLAKQKKERGESPFRILFIGPNGAGKTTTIAKVAHMLLKNNISCIISASDTFRAAAIEQTAYHGAKLGVEVVKGKYGADPASIAFDAIAHAKASGTDVVLIDSAGRQETNKNLMEEMKKMVRVAKPDIKIFIGESITGNSLLEQVGQFNTAIGLDGVILTKLDTDAKGGNTLTILSETKVPILYFGIGEKYDDLMPYDPNFIIGNIVPN